MRFGRVLRMGGIGAIERFVSAGRGVAVLPLYLVEPALKKGALKKVFPAVKPLSDYFRLVHRSDDPRRPLYHALASTMLETPLS